MRIEVGKELPRNGEYDELQQARAFWRASYRGGRKYRDALDAEGQPVLIPHESEQASSAGYKRRKRVTTPTGYCGPIVRRYNDFVWRRDPSVPEYVDGSVYAMLMDDATGTGVSMPGLLRKRLMRAQIDGASYVLIDSTMPRDAGQAVSEAEARARGYRIVLRPIDAGSVLWFDDDNALVLMHDDAGQRFARHYNSTTMQDFTLRKDSLIVATAGEQIAHRIAGLPLVAMQPMLDDESESQVAPLAESQKAIFNFRSLLSEELYANTFTQWVLFGMPPDESKQSGVQYGAKRIFCVSDPQGKMDRIGSEVEQAESLRRQIEQEMAELYRVAGVDGGNPTQSGAPESGVAKAFRFNDLSANLAAMADAVQRCWNTIMRRACGTVGETYPGDVKFPDDFAPPDYGQELVELINSMNSNLPPVIKRKTADRFVDRNLSLSDEEWQEWRDEREMIGVSPLAGMTERMSTEPAS
jgi:hypothetical protein